MYSKVMEAEESNGWYFEHGLMLYKLRQDPVGPRIKLSASSISGRR
jgi:hypothetical protein